jgi:hypothetical protein
VIILYKTMRRILLLLLLVTVFSELTFLQQADDSKKTKVTMEIKQTRPCHKPFSHNECAGLTPPAEGCIWPPNSKNGWCVHKNVNDVMSNVFDL